MNTPADRLLDMIKGRGWAGRIVPIGHLADLREAIAGRYERRLLDETFYQDQLGSLSYDLPADLPGARSIIVVAVPTPQMRVFFARQGTRVPVVIPPTYVTYTARTEDAQAVLAAWLENEGYRLAKPRLPLKTLAVCSGLARYGLNNITYVPGMGSFFQLVGAFSDVPCDRDPWMEAKVLGRCDACRACLRRCPTGAIAEDRFLIRAERCLTYHNEAEGDFPAWIDPAWHHCLVGCMRCQAVCPENKGILTWFEDRVEFSEKETTLLTRSTPPERLPVETTTKLESLEINEAYHLLCRNLSMLIEGNKSEK